MGKEDLTWGYELLRDTSRSFAAVIQALDGKLRDAMMVFYLTLRALDSVEDDPQYPKGKKVAELRSFYLRLDSKKWEFTDKCGEKPAEVRLLQGFQHVLNVYHKLKPGFQSIIRDICRRMGNGMADFVTMPAHVGSIADWNLYCHYVAGLVGIGLSALFVESGLVTDKYFSSPQIEDKSNSLGLFLQKTNIIRDVHEDLELERVFWPSEVCLRYRPKVMDYFEPSESMEACIHCLNDLVTNALGHAADSLEYMSRIDEQSVFLFVAIPQVMAIATLALCYGNPKVFFKIEKIDRAETIAIIAALSESKMAAVAELFQKYLQVIRKKIKANDPNRALTEKACDTIEKICRSHVMIE